MKSYNRSRDEERKENPIQIDIFSLNTRFVTSILKLASGSLDFERADLIQWPILMKMIF